MPSRSTVILNSGENPGEPHTGEDAALVAALQAALRPGSTRERVSQWVVRGYTAIQVYQRLDAALRHELEAGADSVVAGERKGVDRVYRVLLALTASGLVRRRRVHYGMIVNTKGGRGMIVDVFSTA